MLATRWLQCRQHPGILVHIFATRWRHHSHDTLNRMQQMRHFDTSTFPISTRFGTLQIDCCTPTVINFPYPTLLSDTARDAYLPQESNKPTLGAPTCVFRIFQKVNFDSGGLCRNFTTPQGTQLTPRAPYASVTSFNLNNF